MKNKLNLQTKTLVIYVILNIVVFSISLSYSNLPHIILFSYLLILIMHTIFLFLIFCNKPWLQKLAWIVVSIPSIWIMFNPFKITNYPDQYPLGTVLVSFLSLVYKDFDTALIQLVGSIVPILIIAFSISNIKNRTSGKIDYVFSGLLIFFSSFSNVLINLIQSRFGTAGNIDFAQILKAFIILIIYIGLLFVWNKLDNQTQQKVWVEIIID